MVLMILEILPVIAVSVLLGLWIAHILRMWGHCFKRDE